MCSDYLVFGYFETRQYDSPVSPSANRLSIECTGIMARAKVKEIVAPAIAHAHQVLGMTPVPFACAVSVVCAHVGTLDALQNFVQLGSWVPALHHSRSMLASPLAKLCL